MIDTLKVEARMRIGQFSSLFYTLYGLRDSTRRMAVTEETDVVIEGYPRSANSFAVLAFKTAQPEDVSVGHHLHVPVQVDRGIQYGLPTVVLAREPKDAAVSLVIRQPYRTLSQALREYIRFYEYVLVLPRQKYVVAEFETVTTDFGKVVEDLNSTFGTDYRRFDHTEENEQHIFQILQEISPMGRHKNRRGSWPSQKREKKKEEVREKLDDSRYNSLLKRCNNLYSKLTFEK